MIRRIGRRTGRTSSCDARSHPVPTAGFVPCVASLPVGWSFGQLTVNNGRSTITVDHDRADSKAIDLRFAETCDVTGARRFEHGPGEGTDTLLTWAPEVLEDVTAEAARVIGFVPRAELVRALDDRSDGHLQLDPPP